MEIKAGDWVRYGDFTGYVESIGRHGNYAWCRSNLNDIVLPNLYRSVRWPVAELTVVPEPATT